MLSDSYGRSQDVSVGLSRGVFFWHVAAPFLQTDPFGSWAALHPKVPAEPQEPLRAPRALNHVRGANRQGFPLEGHEGLADINGVQRSKKNQSHNITNKSMSS